MRISIGFSLAALLFTVACGGSDAAAPGNTGNTGATGATGATGSTATAVDVDDNSFSPNATTVPANSTITWTWIGGSTHNVTFSTAGITGSGDKTNGGTFQKTFATAGTYNYQCTNHAGMTGKITVTAP